MRAILIVAMALLDVRLGPLDAAMMSGTLALAGVLSSLGIVFLGRWLWRRWHGQPAESTGRAWPLFKTTVWICGGAAWFVDPNDVRGIAAAIAAALGDDDERAARAAAARVVRQWTVEAMAAGYDAVYTRVLEGAR